MKTIKNTALSIHSPSTNENLCTDYRHLTQSYTPPNPSSKFLSTIRAELIYPYAIHQFNARLYRIEPVEQLRKYTDFKVKIANVLQRGKKKTERLKKDNKRKTRPAPGEKRETRIFLTVTFVVITDNVGLLKTL